MLENPWRGRGVFESMGFGGYMVSKGSASGAKTPAGRMLRVGVIGAGVMGSNHGRVLVGLPDVTLVGIVDPVPAHRTRATEMTGCPTFADIEELFAAGVDAVTIAAPTHLHHEVALACIAQGIHVLVEKPIASTSSVSIRLLPPSSRRYRAKTSFRSPSRASDRFHRECRMSVW
jgi:NAD-dependent oxidoreductase involved in siderophore biosynthesis